MTDFAAPAKKYTGKVKVGEGPVPLQRWQSPYLRADRDRPFGAEGVDLHPERTAHQHRPPPSHKAEAKRPHRG